MSDIREQDVDCRSYEVSPAVSNAALREVLTCDFRNCNYDLVQQMNSKACTLSV